jgi:hypothetical protein
MTFTMAPNSFATPLAINDQRKFESRGQHNSRDLLMAGETGGWSQRNKTSQSPALQHITFIILEAVTAAEWH